MRKNILFILIIFMNIFILSGCWNYRDINETRLVQGMAIDYDEKKDEYIITVDIVNPKPAGGGPMKGELLQSRGKLPFDGVRDIIMKIGRKVYWGHAKIMIVSENVAKKKMISVLDYISRDAEFRDDLWIVVSKERTAMEILQAQIDEEHKTHTMISLGLDDVMKSEKSISKYYGVPAWRFIKDLYAEGISPTLPMIKNVSDGERINHKIRGTAVFKKDKMVGSLDGDETKSFLWTIDKLKGGVFVVTSKLSDTPTEITLEISKNKTKVKPIYRKDQLFMKIDIETDVEIAEIGGVENFIDKKGREILKKDAEKSIKKRVEDVITKVQKDYHSDIFKFSPLIKKEMPDLWRKVKPNWDEVFRSLKMDVNVVVNIRGSSLKTEPIKVME